MNCTNLIEVLGTSIPCGQCVHCRINKQREWTGRIMLEDHFTPIESSFVTLTYSPAFVPIKTNTAGEQRLTLDKAALQRFTKRFRKLNGQYRYFACGEYGDPEGGARPHYHAILFGIPATAAWLERLQYAWSIPYENATPEELALTEEDHILEIQNQKRVLLGWVSMSEVNPQRAAYVAGYTVKKKYKTRRRAASYKRSIERYRAAHGLMSWEETPMEKLDRELDEELDGREPEFGIMSKALGDNALNWLEEMHYTEQGCYEMLQRSDCIPAFAFNGKTWPLGIYLKRELRKRLNIPESMKDRHELMGPPRVTDQDYLQLTENWNLAKAKTYREDKAKKTVARLRAEVQTKERLEREANYARIQKKFYASSQAKI